jgi:hypothetical protein
MPGLGCGSGALASLRLGPTIMKKSRWKEGVKSLPGWKYGRHGGEENN